MSKKGFSLIEVLISLLIFSFGVAGVIFLMMNSVKDLQNMRDQVIASMLSQEGVELVRNLKDNEELDGPPYDFDEVNDCSGNKCEELRIDSTLLFFDKSNTHPEKLYLIGSFYVHDNAGTPTKFYRRIDLEVKGSIASSDREIKVTSYVTWNSTGFGAVGTLPTDCTIGNKCVSIVSKMPDIY